MPTQNPYLSPRSGDGPDNPLRSYEARINRAAVTATPNQKVWTRHKPAKPVKEKGWFRRHRKLTAFLVILALLLGAGGWYIFTTGKGKFNLAQLLGSGVKTVLGDKAPIAQSNGRTNILVYGMTEDGLRTDSIILVSYYWQQKKLVMLNIPRDLYTYDGYENDKMGEIYAYAKAREPKNSTYPDTYVASFISKEYNIPIQYWVQFNMQGEVDFINDIGGINIDVPDSFTDCEYPNWTYTGYVRPCPSFTAGEQHMNGATALIYSRSRHSLDNNEGTDFARSKRQQQVIAAVDTKLKGMGVVGNITEISHYLSILGNNMTTNLSTDQMVSLADTLRPLNPNTDFEHGLWETGNGFLCDSSIPSTGEYITLYGQESACTLGNGGIGAGGYTDSEYRDIAAYYIQHLLTSASQSATQFMSAAETALGYNNSNGTTSSNSGN